MRTIKHKWVLLLLLGLFLLLLLIRRGTVAERGMEARLEERYGKPFTVMASYRIPIEERAEDVWTGKAYIVAPEEDLHNRFFAYSFLEIDPSGKMPSARRTTDTYGLNRLMELFREAAQEAGLEEGISYERKPFGKTEEYYYGRILCDLVVNPQNVERACRSLADTLRRFAEETGVTPEDGVEARFLFHYREDDWPEERKCTVSFAWEDPLSWEGAPPEACRRPELWGDTLLEWMLHEVEAYKVRYAEMEEIIEEGKLRHADIWEELNPAAPEPGPPPGITQREDGVHVVRGDKVELTEGGVRLWDEAAQTWSEYLWNEETQQYDRQAEP